MLVYYPSGNCGSSSGTIPAYSCSPCADREYARIRSIAIYKKSSPFTNMASVSEWTTKIAAGNAIVLWQVNGSLSDTATESLAGFGDSEFENGSTSWTVEIKDPNVIENTDFYNALKLSTEWVLVYKTSSRIWDTGEVSNISVKPIISDNLKDVVVYQSTFKYVNDDLPTSYAIPFGIFDRCYTTT